ncbi:MAG: SOS response-associated peptidase [Chitinophagales bacterium]|jgi:putative SOS response-associated peptidase YedK|nr:SOS response-associated peptidase [Chitinophagales bacterium]
MCFHVQQSIDAQKLAHRFGAKPPRQNFPAIGAVSGFTHPQCLVLTNDNMNEIQPFYWGLMPGWAKDLSFRKNTLNARIETISEKPSYRQVTQNRCIVLVDAFYEWQWLDEKGKLKQKYKIHLPHDEPFGLGGLWSRWIDKVSGEQLDTFTILTMAANELMSEIHNSKKRMPLVFSPDHAALWLLFEEDKLDNDDLCATKI